MGSIGFCIKGAEPFLAEKEIENLEPYVKLANDKLKGRCGPGNDYLGWIDLPKYYDKNEFERILCSAEKIKSDSDILVVIGIGGSYLGARAGIEALSHNFSAMLDKDTRGGVQVLYAGNNLSAPYLQDLLDVLENRKVSLNVISKSGTTTEPAIAFRILKGFMDRKYGTDAKNRIYATTDPCKGALRSLSEKEKYVTFNIPGDVGGRYSVLTAVGLLPLAAAGIDICAMMSGAAEASATYQGMTRLADNPACMYAAVRNALYRKGYTTEILVNYEPNLHFFCEWWKQLFGESEGKDHKGIFPAAADFSSDLHSMGQFIQDGTRNLFETALRVTKPRRNDIIMEKAASDIDELNYLCGKDLDYVNKKAAEGTYEAHITGGVPNLVIEMQSLDAANFGAAVYFFEYACAISGYLLGVNPFDQPGVELYKKNMFRLLGKPDKPEKPEKA